MERKREATIWGLGFRASGLGSKPTVTDTNTGWALAFKHICVKAALGLRL